MTRIAHLSDIHFGRIAYPEIVDALVEEVNALGVDLVVASGDLTQRALPEQFRAAAAMLAAFDAPTLTVPGNHDVYAWWHQPFLRVFDPLRRYRQRISDDLAPTFMRDGVAVLGINSAYGRTIKGGYIGSRERARVEAFFAGQDAAVFKVLVVHHHLVQLQALARHDVARHARKTLAAAARGGVELVLCGHLHISHVEPMEVTPGRRRLVVASAGTATSNRGRHAHRDTNFYNVVTVAAEGFTIEERRYDPDARRFETDRRTRFDRTGA